MAWNCPICKTLHMGNNPQRCCGKWLKIDVHNSYKYPCNSAYAGQWEFIKVLVCDDQESSSSCFRH